MAENPFTLSEGLALMERVKREQGGGESGGASSQDLREAEQRLLFPVPQTWASILKIANQFAYSHDGYAFRFYSSRIIHTTTESTFYFLCDYMPVGLVIGDEFTGDGLILDLSQQSLEGDCPVVMITHEGGEEIERWVSVAAFLQWLFAAEEVVA